MEDFGRIIPVDIEEQMKSAYIDYSMSVIVSRALPDVRDGLKPVHRRILYSMNELGLLHSSPHKKCATIVGDVLGKYHPHGDSSVYDALVRLAQPWSMRYTLVDGQGNFGSIDGDSPAAYRYTEARLETMSNELLADIDKETVDFQNNFDDSRKEPVVLPTKIPNLLVNGSSGIAVGMATNMPPHNLSEVVDGIVAYIDNKEISTEDLLQYVKAPDFPTGCTIYGYDGVKDALLTGKGRIIMRGDVIIEDAEHAHGHERIVITSIPYQVNKSEMVQKIANLVKDAKIEGISEIRDESKRDVRVVLELKRDARPSVVLNKLYQYSPLQTSYNVNNVALVNSRPQTLNIRDLIVCFVNHRHQVVIRRAQFELKKAQERMHLVEGFIKALDIIDEIIALIKSSHTVDIARQGLMDKWGFSKLQADAIVEMRLRQLTGLAREELQKEYDELKAKIDYLNSFLSDESMRMEVIKTEMLEIKAKYGDDRRSRIEYAASDFRIEDVIADDDVVITITHQGYIKRTSLNEYRVQNRGGKGLVGANTRRTDDFIEHIYTATNHNYLLFFTEKGKCFWLRVFEIVEGGRTSKGQYIKNLINLEDGDNIKAIINLKSISDADYINNNYVILCTEKGIVKKTSLEAYSRPRKNGINAITVRDGDTLLNACLTNGKSVVLLASYAGKAVRFRDEQVRPMGRNASGVKGITLSDNNDRVVGMICVEDDNKKDILVVSEHGYGKRSSLDDYRETNRGGKGVKTINITETTGNLVAIKDVTDEDDLMIMNRSGITIRMKVSDLRILGRTAQGVRLINLKETDSIAAVTQVPTEEISEESNNNDETGTEEVE